VARRLRKASFVGVREPTDSLRFCERAGLRPGAYALMGDDSFGLEPAAPAAVEELLDRHGLRPGRFLAVNLRVGKYTRYQEDYGQRFAALVRELGRRHARPLLVVPIALGEGDSDAASGRRLQAACGGDAVRVLDAPGLTASLVKGVLGRAFAAVGTSYHFCTFALSQGVPAVAVYDGTYYSQKAAGVAAFWQDERL